MQFAPGAYYHMFNRGAARQSIFRDDDNYLFVLRRMKQYAAELNVKVIAYCLMPNHYHWLVRQDGPEAAGLLPQRVFNSYTKAFNKRYNRTGTLFETRFKCKLVDNDVYLKHLCRYIHANPVRDGFAAAPELWPYSNYLEWIGERPGKLFDPAFVERHFPQRESYREFVYDYLSGSSQLPEQLLAYLRGLYT
ncbi:MAG: transposase [Caldilineae bacterium]|nr:MAG: transposase [Caldilineae bacterium]